MGNKGLEEFHHLLIERLTEVIKKNQINCIGYIFPNQGPAGVIQLRALLAEKLDAPSIIIRVNERLLRNQIWFESNDIDNPPLSPKSKLLLFGDAATSGASIYRSSLIAANFGSECKTAFVIYDRQQGARERLIVKGIELIPFMSKNIFEEFGELQKKDTELDLKSSRAEFESVKSTIDI